MLTCSSVCLKLPQPLLQNRRNEKSNNVPRRSYKVTVIGASGGIGQPLSLLLKQNPLVRELSLHDVANTLGVGADLSHVCTSAAVEAFVGDDELMESLYDSQVVVVPAGMPRKPGMSREDLFAANAGIAAKVACLVSEACPEALLAFITNPINSIVPIAAEFLKAKKVFNPKRLFGVTTLDVVRARTFIGDFINVDPQKVTVPVIGGHAGITILPLISQCKPRFDGEDEDVQRLTHRIQEAGTEVVKAKAGKGSATLSMAYAAAHFVNALLRGLSGEQKVIECAYVASDATELPFFASPLLLGPEGIQRNFGVCQLQQHEQEALKKLLPLLKKNIEQGLSYAQAEK